MIGLLLAAALLGPADLAAEAASSFERGEYAAGIEKLEQAYALDPDPAFLFAQAAGYQQLAQYERAIVLYERFLGSGPARPQAEKAYQRIQECRAAQGEPKPPPPVVTPAPAPVPPAEQASVDERQGDGQPRDTQSRGAPPWARDVTGGVLLGVGVVAGIAGGTMIGVGASRRRGAEQQGTEDRFRADLRSSNALQGVGIGLAVGGGALLLGAVIRYAIVARRQGPRTAVLRF